MSTIDSLSNGHQMVLKMNESSPETDPSVTLRPGSVADSYTVFNVFEAAIADLTQRLGMAMSTSAPDPAEQAQAWKKLRSLYEHLASTAEQFWLAEREGRAIGFARSILRDGVRELTEFFVAPDQQSVGVGRALLAHAFPADDAIHRVIIATIDSRAQALYLKAGVYPRFPIYRFDRTPEPVTVATDLEFIPVTVSPETLAVPGVLDRAIIEYQRDADHTWLLTDRQGYLYCRNGRLVGYGYIGTDSGPFALLDDADFPAVLAHAETEAAKHGYEFGIHVPMINRAAINYLLARGYRMGTFIVFFMSDAPFGKFEHYIVTRPMFFL